MSVLFTEARLDRPTGAAAAPRDLPLIKRSLRISRLENFEASFWVHLCLPHALKGTVKAW
jgi:hypothetical protein